MSNKSFFKRFAEKWLIQYNHPPYYSKVNQYRYPAPGDTHVNDGVKPAKGAPEFEFQTAMYKRNSIKTTPFPGETANEEPSILPEGNPWVSPSHMPVSRMHVTCTA